MFSTWAWADLTGIDKFAKEMTKAALISLDTAMQLNEFNQDKIYNILSSMPIEKTVIESICPINMIADCIPGKFRSYSGHCNNVQKSLWGATYEPFQRLQPPDYFDGMTRKNFSVL